MTKLSTAKSIPINEVAARLGLDWAGSRNKPCFKGHGERTPCLHVYHDSNTWKCFSCGAGGDVITLVMEFFGIEFKEALKWLEGDNASTKAHLEAIRRAPQDMRSASPTTKISGKLFSDVYGAFMELLDGAEAMQYLRSRGLRRDIIEDSGIKCLPKNYGGIVEAMGKAFDGDTLTKAGLFYENNGKLIPVFFKNRMVIPYYGFDGKSILTLQGRNIDTQENPKYFYLRGIEAPLYRLESLESAKLYGGGIVICEGVIDCLTALQLEMYFPIAVGSATNRAIYSDDIFEELGNFSILLACDNDIAGQKFTLEFIKAWRKRHPGRALPKIIDWEVVGGKDLNELLRGERENGEPTTGKES